MDLQLYTDKVIVEADGRTTLATLIEVDLGQIKDQIPLDELLDLYDCADIDTYLQKRIKEDRE